MVNEDLEQENSLAQNTLYTVDFLKKKYRTLREAKTDFGLKASSWEILVQKINDSASEKLKENYPSQASISERLSVIETEIKNIRDNINQILSLLQQIILDKERKQ